MPKVLKSYNTDYKIASRPGGEITLDPGSNGKVIVTGNLQVDGETTTVNTVDLEIEDNLIVLNKGPNNNLAIQTAGIEINRTDSNIQWLFDNSISWTLGTTTGQGTFYAQRVVDGQKLPLNTPGILSPSDFYITTPGYISVEGSVNYERSVLNYIEGAVTPDNSGSIIKDDDIIPNTKAVADLISYNFENNAPNSIREGNSDVEVIDQNHVISNIVSINDLGDNTSVISTKNRHSFSPNDLVDIVGISANSDPVENLNGLFIKIIEVLNDFTIRIDKSVTNADPTQYIAESGIVKSSYAEESNIKFTVSDNTIGQFFSDRFVIEDIELSNNEIKSLSTNSDLTLKSAASGTVKIDDVLELTAFPWDNNDSLPASPSNGVKVYSTQTAITGDAKDQTLGKSGIFFVNSNNDQDELVSRRRSLLYSMIF